VNRANTRPEKFFMLAAEIFISAAPLSKRIHRACDATATLIVRKRRPRHARTAQRQLHPLHLHRLLGPQYVFFLVQSTARLL